LGENVFGRESGPEIFRDDPYLSPKHALFSWDGSRLEVRDLESLNGVYYRIVEAVELRHGDRIRLGRQLLEFELLEEVAPCIPFGDNSVRLLGAPTTAWGRLVRVSSPNGGSEAFVLSRPEEVLGRERGDILFRDDGFVSGRHARIVVEDGRYFLEDLRSSNGTFLKIREHRTLKDGDLLLMGQQPLRAFLGN
jgi:pSer/pThr/pTyr-binding forkhead associated (FHA) protein